MHGDYITVTGIPLFYFFKTICSNSFEMTYFGIKGEYTTAAMCT